MKRSGIILLLVTVALSTAGSQYLRSHPGSIAAYLVFSLGVHIFEPSYTERQAGIVLISDFVSYSSIPENEAKLKNAGVSWKRIPDALPDLRTTSRPPFAETQLIVETYTHLGCRGELHLNFLNDRLQAVLFYPADFGKYTKAVEASEGKTLETPSGMENQFWIKAGDRKITVGTELMDKKRQFVGWYDPRFDEEISAWITRYS